MILFLTYFTVCDSLKVHILLIARHLPSCPSFMWRNYPVLSVQFVMLFLRLLAAATNILTPAPLCAGLPCIGMKGGQRDTAQPSTLMCATKEVLGWSQSFISSSEGTEGCGTFWPCPATCPDAQHSQGLGPESTWINKQTNKKAHLGGLRHPQTECSDVSEPEALPSLSTHHPQPPPAPLLLEPLPNTSGHPRVARTQILHLFNVYCQAQLINPLENTNSTY